MTRDLIREAFFSLDFTRKSRLKKLKIVVQVRAWPSYIHLHSKIQHIQHDTPKYSLYCSSTCIIFIQPLYVRGRCRCFVTADRC